MKEEDKYYKPELDEIYTTPDLYYNGEGVFSGKILINPFAYRTKQLYFDLRDELNLDTCLVKYLNIEDIKELGFRVERISQDKDEFEWKVFDSENENFATFCEGFIENGAPDNIEIYGVNFRIKNKSELKRLLIQLGLL